MKILVVPLYSSWRPHLETELEIMQRHLDDGDEVEAIRYVHPGIYLDAYRRHAGILSRLSYQSRIERGLRLLEPKVDAPTVVLESREGAALPEIKSPLELTAFDQDGFDMGYGVLSSLISITRDPAPTMAKTGPLIAPLWEGAWSLYQDMRERLRAQRPDRVYVFNGRFVFARAVYRACQAEGVDCFLHERASSLEKFAVLENHLPHDIAPLMKLIEDRWREASDAGGDPGDSAADFYRDRRNRVFRNWHSLVEGQEKGRLPDDWEEERENIVFFNSSEDEFVSIGEEWRNPIYATQNEGMVRIAGALRDQQPDARLYLRVHPNLKGVVNDQIRGLEEVEKAGVTVIPADSEIDTYSLMDAADKVVVFGSTTGIEAAFWGKPVVVAGPSFYRGLGSTYEPSSHDETVELLKSKLEARDKLGALKYGHYMGNFGTPFRYFEPSDVFSGKFRNVTVEPSPGLRLVERIWARIFHGVRRAKQWKANRGVPGDLDSGVHHPSSS